MNKKLLLAFGLGSMALLPTQASAHIAYFEITSLSPVVSGLSKTYSGGDTFESNFGWAAAADADWGDSHHAGWVKFLLSEQSAVNINVSRNPTNNAFQVGDLTPSFSIYSGELPNEAHDAANASLYLLAGKEGLWNALGDTTMANDSDEIGTIFYLGHAGGVDSLATSVAWAGVLGPGVYTVAVGGSCSSAACLDDFTNRAYNMTLTTTPVPLPGAAWLMLTGLLGFTGIRQRKLT